MTTRLLWKNKDRAAYQLSTSASSFSRCLPKVRGAALFRNISRIFYNRRFQLRGIVPVIVVVVLKIPVFEAVKVEVGQQFVLDVVYRFFQTFQEFIEVFFVEKYLVPLVLVAVKALFALGNDQVIIIAFGGLDIKKIGPSFPRFDLLEKTSCLSL